MIHFFFTHTFHAPKDALFASDSNVTHLNARPSTIAGLLTRRLSTIAGFIPPNALPPLLASVCRFRYAVISSVRFPLVAKFSRSVSIVIVRSPLPHMQAHASLVRFNRSHSVPAFPCCQVLSVRCDHPQFNPMLDLPRQAAWISHLISSSDLSRVTFPTLSNNLPTIFRQSSTHASTCFQSLSNHLPTIFRCRSNDPGAFLLNTFQRLSNNLPTIFHTCKHVLPIIF